MRPTSIFRFFFFNDTATTEIYTLSLHDALPISYQTVGRRIVAIQQGEMRREVVEQHHHGRISPCWIDRKSTRLNSSHLVISYAVFCLKKKKKRLAVKSRGSPQVRAGNIDQTHG